MANEPHNYSGRDTAIQATSLSHPSEAATIAAEKLGNSRLRRNLMLSPPLHVVSKRRDAPRLARNPRSIGLVPLSAKFEDHRVHSDRSRMTRQPPHIQ